MRGPVDELSRSRLEGTLALGCPPCRLFSLCGGLYRRGGALDCMDRCRSCDPATCDRVCPKNPRFHWDVLEVGGFKPTGITPLFQPIEPALLPTFAPQIYGARRGAEPLRAHWVAVPLRQVVVKKGKSYGPRFASLDELRQAFHLAPSTNVILVGIAPDAPIERYWEHRREHRVVELLAELGVALAIVPNYSMFLDDPRTHHLHSRRRSLIVAAEWSRAGIPTVPYLQAVSPPDWDFWLEFLSAHPEVRCVAKEFQTGYANPDRAQMALNGIAELQEKLGRSLHLIAVGGTQFARLIQDRFATWTLIDGNPYLRATRWREARVTSTRIRWRHRPLAEPAALLQHNVDAYRGWIERSSQRGDRQPLTMEAQALG